MPPSVLCLENFLGEFASYLAMKAVDKHGDLLKRDTCLSYFSGVKEVQRSKYKDSQAPFLKDERDWYAPMRNALEKVVERRTILSGERIADKSNQIGGYLIHKISSHSLKAGTIDSLKKRFKIF